MYPHAIDVVGVRLEPWVVAIGTGVVVGYVVLRATLRGGGRAPLPRALPVRWAVTVYGALLGAQLFSYAFDRDTSLLPPASTSAFRYYLDPSAGTKTLFGAIVFLPVTLVAVTRPWGDLPYAAALRAWTPALWTVLAGARVGCFLTGCCYGVEVRWLGLPFPPGSRIHGAQMEQGRLDPGAWSHPVVPTQLLEAAALAALACWSFGRVRRGAPDVFGPTVALYAVARFALETVRADPERNVFGPLSTSQWIAVAVVGLWGLAVVTRRTRRPAGAVA